MRKDPGADRHILVVEDEAINRSVLARQLAMVGVAAEMAVDGDDGLLRWREGDFALVLSDLHMPVKDGFALVRAIRAEEGAGPRTPVLAFSADARVGQAERAREAGFDAFLTKPLQLEGLRAVLGRWMAQAPPPGTRRVPAAAAMPRAEAVFDVHALREIVGDEPSVMVEIVAYFDTVATGIRAELLRAAASGDAAEAVMLAHRLKSSSRSVGALPLGRLCAVLEDEGATATGSTGSLVSMVADVVDALDAALHAMRGWRGAGPAAAEWQNARNWL
ncbi:response regulator [Luteimonas sp. MJ246]|uniref:response regulator n=1 Tax=Luteimonas sp. MJ174 TaxID=3129237 RepID=UPI0031BA21E7